MIPINLSGFTANAASPKYDPSYPTGNRPAGGTLIGFADFTNGNVTPTSIASGTWWGYETAGGTIAVENGAVKLGFASNGNGVPNLVFNFPDLNTREFFLEFDAQTPIGVDGCKFVKIFGQHPEGAYATVANTTVGLDYTGVADGKGTLHSISFGDGASDSNDTQNTLALDGSYPAGVGRSYPSTAVISTPQNHSFSRAMWGTTSHHFRIYIKFNDGTTAQNEVANGAYYLEIDGLVYVNATGLFNRHYSNLPIDYVRFGDYTRDNAAFDLKLDNIKFSLGGFTS